MGQARNWSKKEYEQLAEEWGHYSIPTIAERLGRSVNGVHIKASQLGLGAHLENSQYVSLNVLMKTLGINGGYSYTVQRFINAGFPIRFHKVKNNSFKVVDVDEFWAWLEQNKQMIDLSRMEEGALGKEPEWARTKRLEDYNRAVRIKPHNTPWTPAEDKELLRLLKSFRYTYMEISQLLHRSEGAIQRRVCDLNIKERPLKADNHTQWTEKELCLLCEMIKNGSNYENMSLALGKSAKAIRGKVYSTYLTENLSAVAQMIGDGVWGNGRPERKLSQRNLMTLDEKTELKESMSRLAGLIAYSARAHFDYQDNWQRSLCKNWHETKGCLAGETNCDECSSFVRIRPQYCARCGITFYEREDNRMCENCRLARRKLGYRKYIRKQNQTKGRIL